MSGSAKEPIFKLSTQLLVNGTNPTSTITGLRSCGVFFIFALAFCPIRILSFEIIVILNGDGSKQIIEVLLAKMVVFSKL